MYSRYLIYSLATLASSVVAQLLPTLTITDTVVVTSIITVSDIPTIPPPPELLWCASLTWPLTSEFPTLSTTTLSPSVSSTSISTTTSTPPFPSGIPFVIVNNATGATIARAPDGSIRIFPNVLNPPPFLISNGFLIFGQNVDLIVFLESNFFNIRKRNQQNQYFLLQSNTLDQIPENALTRIFSLDDGTLTFTNTFGETLAFFQTDFDGDSYAVGGSFGLFPPNAISIDLVVVPTTISSTTTSTTSTGTPVVTTTSSMNTETENMTTTPMSTMSPETPTSTVNSQTTESTETSTSTSTTSMESETSTTISSSTSATETESTTSTTNTGTTSGTTTSTRTQTTTATTTRSSSTTTGTTSSRTGTTSSGTTNSGTTSTRTTSSGTTSSGTTNSGTTSSGTTSTGSETTTVTTSSSTTSTSPVVYPTNYLYFTRDGIPTFFYRISGTPFDRIAIRPRDSSTGISRLFFNPSTNTLNFDSSNLGPLVYEPRGNSSSIYKLTVSITGFQRLIFQPVSGRIDEYILNTFDSRFTNTPTLVECPAGSFSIAWQAPTCTGDVTIRTLTIGNPPVSTLSTSTSSTTSSTLTTTSTTISTSTTTSATSSTSAVIYPTNFLYFTKDGSVSYLSPTSLDSNVNEMRVSSAPGPFIFFFVPREKTIKLSGRNIPIESATGRMTSDVIIRGSFWTTGYTALTFQPVAGQTNEFTLDINNPAMSGTPQLYECPDGKLSITWVTPACEGNVIISTLTIGNPSASSSTSTSSSSSTSMSTSTSLVSSTTSSVTTSSSPTSSSSSTSSTSTTTTTTTSTSSASSSSSTSSTTTSTTPSTTTSTTASTTASTTPSTTTTSSTSRTPAIPTGFIAFNINQNIRYSTGTASGPYLLLQMTDNMAGAVSGITYDSVSKTFKKGNDFMIVGTDANTNISPISFGPVNEGTTMAVQLEPEPGSTTGTEYRISTTGNVPTVYGQGFVLSFCHTHNGVKGYLSISKSGYSTDCTNQNNQVELTKMRIEVPAP